MASYLTSLNDLSLDLSDFMLSLHVIPELRPGQDGVTSEYADSVQLGIRVAFGWQASADNVELSHL